MVVVWQAAVAVAVQVVHTCLSEGCSKMLCVHLMDNLAPAHCNTTQYNPKFLIAEVSSSSMASIVPAVAAQVEAQSQAQLQMEAMVAMAVVIAAVVQVSCLGVLISRHAPHANPTNVS